MNTEEAQKELENPNLEKNQIVEEKTIINENIKIPKKRGRPKKENMIIHPTIRKISENKIEKNNDKNNSDLATTLKNTTQVIESNIEKENELKQEVKENKIDDLDLSRLETNGDTNKENFLIKNNIAKEGNEKLIDNIKYVPKIKNPKNYSLNYEESLKNFKKAKKDEIEKYLKSFVPRDVIHAKTGEIDTEQRVKRQKCMFCRFSLFY
ncbi:hypothetical protein GVAV_001174 [Gurleya vavrai]